jgi:hypothetical protein
MRVKRHDLIQINIIASTELHSQLARLQEAGLSFSAIARLAIRKCSGQPLDDETTSPLTKRLLLHLHPDDALMLDNLAKCEGKRSRARTLRRLIVTYLRINAAAIDQLF